MEKDYYKRYYQKNKDKLKKYRQKYYEKNKSKEISRNKDYYARNKNNILIRQGLYNQKNKEKIHKYRLSYEKKTNWKSSKTKTRKEKGKVRAKTRYHFPLDNQKCNFCDNLATQHHHYTQPMQFSKFDYVCDTCHDKLSNRNQQEIK